MATPIDWDERGTRGLLFGARYTIENVFRRLAHKGDPWADIWSHGQSLTQVEKKLELG